MLKSPTPHDFHRASQNLRLDWTRRQFVQGIGFGGLGLGLPQLVAPSVAHALNSSRTAKRCLMLFLFGGPAQSDTFDMKPEAAVEYRGEFNPIATSVPGIEWTEHLPKTAKLAHHIALVRSVTMSEKSIGDHHADTYYILTGHRPDRSFFLEGINRKVHDDDWPCISSAVANALGHPAELPGVVQMPALSGEVTAYINPGQFAGKLGPNYEPLMIRGVLEKPRDLAAPEFLLPAEISSGRMNGRRDLLVQLDDWQRGLDRQTDTALGSLAANASTGSSLSNWIAHQRKAFDLLTSPKAKQAFDVSLEPEETRVRYGNDINGQSVLLARRLLEAGVPSVCVHWIGQRVGAGLSWDTHSDNFGQLKNVLLPAFDSCFSALLEDLHDRGMLEETLVFVAGEMGRTPKVGDPRTGGKGPPGRDHWIHLLPALFAGGGISGGQVYGSSDAIAAYPADNPVTPCDLAATVFHALGIPDTYTYQDALGRPYHLLEEGEPLPLFG
ncbi:MAG: DUF1501 domain-containing protein [Planctomycetaceae bacterium]